MTFVTGLLVGFAAGIFATAVAVAFAEHIQHARENRARRSVAARVAQARDDALEDVDWDAEWIRDQQRRHP